MKIGRIVLLFVSFIFIVLLFAFSSWAAVQENDWRLESIDCKTFAPTETFVGLAEVDICYNLTNLKNQNRNFNQTIKFYPETPDSTNLKSFAKWGNISYNSIVLDYGNVSYNQTYYNIINQTNATHYAVQEVASNTTTIQKYCNAASLTNEWCQWYNWEINGSHNEGRWKFDWDHYPNSQFVKIGNDYFKINELQIPANGNIIFKGRVHKETTNLGPSNWKLDIKVSDGTLNATLDPWWNASWQNHYPLIITNFNGTHENEPLIVNVTNVSCSDALDKSDLRLLLNNATEIAFQWVVVNQSIAFRANTTGTGISTDYSIFCNNPSASDGNTTTLFNGIYDAENQSTDAWRAPTGATPFTTGITGNKTIRGNYIIDLNTSGGKEEVFNFTKSSGGRVWSSFRHSLYAYAPANYASLFSLGSQQIGDHIRFFNYYNEGNCAGDTQGICAFRLAGNETLFISSYKLGTFYTWNFLEESVSQTQYVTVKHPTLGENSGNFTNQINITINTIDMYGAASFSQAFDDVFISESPIQQYSTPATTSIGLLTVFAVNTPPNHTTPLLVSTSGKNFNTDNLTCLNQSTSDAEGDVVTNVYNFFTNSTSLIVLNIPFETGATDYSGFSNNGTVFGATKTNSSKIGKALSFNGSGGFVFVPDKNQLDLTSKGTWELWFKRASTGTEQVLFDKTNVSGQPNYRLKLLLNNTLEFSFLSAGAAAQDQSWLTNTQTEFELGTFEQTKWSGSAVELNKTSADQQIFFDGFESGNFATKGWVVSGPGSPWVVSAFAPYQGTYHARALQPGAGTETRLAVNFSTMNFTNVYLLFQRQMIGLDPADDFSVDYFDGATYINLISIDGNDASYQLMNISLPANASNNPNIGIRFRCAAGAATEECRVDNVEVRGTASAYVSNGNYTSKVFDAGQNVQWKNLSWNWNSIQNLPFQVRSCDDNLCVGENFIGPDNTSNTFFNTSTFNDVSNVPTNRYAQFKAHFSTTNLSQTPTLYEVRIGYTTPAIPPGLVNLTSTTSITDTTNFHHIAVTYDNSLTSNNLKIYIDGNLQAQKTETRPASFLNNDLYIGKSFDNTSYFNGAIDEFRIYNKALTAEQVRASFETKYNTLTAAETQPGDIYQCSVTPNDGQLDGITLKSNNITVLWEIRFNVTDSFDGSNLNDVNISCNAPTFNQLGDLSNPYGPFGFTPGSYSCTFKKFNYFDKTTNFSADNDKTLNVPMSLAGFLSPEEHNWLEAVYQCLILGDCTTLDILRNINNTTTRIWEQVRPADAGVVLKENKTSLTLSSTSNITIDYNISIPAKFGYRPNDLLPIRISYWIINDTTKQCYNQGDLPSGVNIDPFCTPLMAQTLGPMDGTVAFTVKLRPNLPAGTYDIVRRIDIDPQGTWINYGQEKIGKITVLEANNNALIDIKKIGESLAKLKLVSEKPKVEEKKEQPQPQVTVPQQTQPVQEQKTEQPSPISGLITLTKGTLSESGIIIIVAIIAGTLIVIFLINSITKIKIYKYRSSHNHLLKKNYFSLYFWLFYLYP